MTASAKSIRGSTQGIDYLIAEHKGYELDRNLIYGETSAEIMKSFKLLQNENTTCDKKFFTAFISPEPKDGARLDDRELRKISRDFMKGIGVNPDKQAYLAIVHTEKNHKHIHLLINRIDENNKAIKDNFIVLKAHNTIHNIAKERGLISAREVMYKNLEKKESHSKDVKKQMYEAHKQVIRMRPKTLTNYIKYMDSTGYSVQPTMNSSGKIQGFRIKSIRTGEEFKMSEVKRTMSSEIQRTLKLDIETNEKSNSKFLDTHNQVMKLKPPNFGKYSAYMKSMGYEIKLSLNKKGKIESFMANSASNTIVDLSKNIQSVIGNTFFTDNSSKMVGKNMSEKDEFYMDNQQHQAMLKQMEDLSKGISTESTLDKENNLKIKNNESSRLFDTID